VPRRWAPPGTRLALGSAVIEVTDQPHLGYPKFAARFGGDAWRFVNSRVGRELRLRGMNARVVVSGTVRPGDAIRKCGRSDCHDWFAPVRTDVTRQAPASASSAITAASHPSMNGAGHGFSSTQKSPRS
jgi:MOSC domain-containing protein YiiM